MTAQPAPHISTTPKKDRGGVVGSDAPARALGRRLIVSLLLACLCLSIALIADSIFLRSIELQAYDLLISARGPAAPPDNLVIVDFDEAAVRAYNAFPIPRGLLADVLEKVGEGEPGIIGLDILLDQKRADTEDHHLAEILSRLGNVILVSEYGFGRLPLNDPLPLFRKAAAGVAFGDLPKDEDGAVRRMLLEVVKQDYRQVSLPVAVADLYSGQHLRPGGADFHWFGATRVPLVRTNPDSALINFHTSFPVQVVPVGRLLAPNFDPQVLRGRIVLVGQSSEVGKDLFTTPVFRFRLPGEGRTALSGTEIHAAAIDTLLSAKTIRPITKPLLWSLNFLLVWLLMGLVITARLHYAVLGTVAAILAAYLLALYLFSVHHVWFPFASTEGGVVLALPAGLGYRFLHERRLKALAEAERRQLMGLFERYVSPEVVAEIWKRRDEIVLAGEERTVTVLFSDIRSFTALTAGKPSCEVLAWLNSYLAAMSEVVQANRGFLNKFIGDGIMVVFGVPLSESVKEDACRAARTALQMLDRVEELNQGRPSEQPVLKIGIGMHTGPVSAGNVGSAERLEYSVIGETVNLASRLESLTKEFKTSIVMSPVTYELVRDRYATYPLGDAQVRGFQGKIRVYGVEPKRARVEAKV